jgi:hypothetical protein
MHVVQPTEKPQPIGLAADAGDRTRSDDADMNVPATLPVER